MGVKLEPPEGDVTVLRITGLLKKSEIDILVGTNESKWTPETKLKVLVLLEDFKGWERGPDWGDISFLIKHDKQIEKIAIVGDPKWRTEFLVFVGEGYRHAAVQFFAAAEVAFARFWLRESRGKTSPEQSM